MEKSVKNYSGRERIVPALLLVIGLICASWISTQTGRKETSDQTNVVAADTIKKQKKNSNKKAEVKTKENFNSEEKAEIEQGREEENEVSFHPVPPIPDFEFAIPPIPDLEAVPALPLRELSLMLEDLEEHEFFLKNENDWEAFSKEFEENFKSKFGDFYEKNEKDIQKMMEDQQKVNGNFDKDWEMKMQGFASQQEEWTRKFAEDWAKQDENFRKSAEMYRNAEEVFRISAENNKRKSMEDMELDRTHQLDAWDLLGLQFEKSHREFERNMKAFEEKYKRLEEAKSELIKDGYIGKDEEIETIRRDNGSIEVNGKKIKPADEEKYNDLLFGC